MRPPIVAGGALYVTWQGILYKCLASGCGFVPQSTSGPVSSTFTPREFRGQLAYAVARPVENAANTLWLTKPDSGNFRQVLYSPLGTTVALNSLVSVSPRGASDGGPLLRFVTLNRVSNETSCRMWTTDGSDALPTPAGELPVQYRSAPDSHFMPISVLGDSTLFFGPTSSRAFGIYLIGPSAPGPTLLADLPTQGSNAFPSKPYALAGRLFVDGITTATGWQRWEVSPETNSVIGYPMGPQSFTRQWADTTEVRGKFYTFLNIPTSCLLYTSDAADE